MSLVETALEACFGARRLALAAVVAPVMALGLAASPVQAQPVLDGGWFEDNIPALAPAIVSDQSPYVFDLLAPAFFRITDAFLLGDTYTVFDDGGLILTTTEQAFPFGFGDNPTADDAWTDPDFSSGEVLLAAGSHSIVVDGDGAGGLPAGFFVRLDSADQVVPLPAPFVLLGTALIGLGFVSRRRRA